MPTAQPPATIAPLSQRSAWAELAEHSKKLSGRHLRKRFAEDSERDWVGGRCSMDSAIGPEQFRAKAAVLGNA